MIFPENRFALFRIML